MKKLIVLALTLFCSLTGLASEFKLGEDYELLEPADPQLSGKLVEFFSYNCPYCYRAQPAMQLLKTDSRFKLEIVLQPVLLGKKSNEPMAMLWYISQKLNKTESLHQYIFDVVQFPVSTDKEFNKLETLESIEHFFRTVLGDKWDKNSYDAVLKEIEKEQLFKKADSIAAKYKVKGTPTFIVNGKYIIGGIPIAPDGTEKLRSLVMYLSTKD